MIHGETCPTKSREHHLAIAVDNAMIAKAVDVLQSPTPNPMLNLEGYSLGWLLGPVDKVWHPYPGCG